MSASRRPHDSDAVRVEPPCRRLVPDDANRALGILPGSRVLCDTLRTRMAVAERHDGDALRVQVAADRRDFVAVWLGAVVRAASGL